MNTVYKYKTDKIIKVFESSEKEYKNEVKIHKICAENNIAPKIICAGKGIGKLSKSNVLIMEKMEMTLFDYYKKYGKISMNEFRQMIYSKFMHFIT